MQTALRDRLRIASDYVRFRLKANSRFTIHSPFLFELVNEVFRDKRNFYAFDEIENLRLDLLRDKTVINENHLGEKSKALPAKRRVGEIVRIAALPAEYCRMLFKLVSYLRPANILELGTGTGFSTLYLAAAAAPAPVITLEGSHSLSQIAQEQFKKMNLHNIKTLTGDFRDTLPQALQQLGHPGLVFIDGDHRKDALLNNLNQCMKRTTAETVIVIDDIYWSEEMKKAWHETIHLSQVSMSIDLFRVGILFFREDIKKQHLKVVY